ncbi:uncharacterized protein LOC131954745 [Physella acuta]|uniref:uncharacterized protein LOC131954745 n=1 Tax=Physella acuta TaxID=109671 RepID=UPI0027DB66DD|nr:uncharacterized protein LOC131954745 [Physella acuta]
MEGEEEEEANSLLSLSQTFLQPDSSSSITLSSNHLHNWPASSSGAVGDIVGQFSPVSPAENYSSQVLNANENFDRFYNCRPYSSGQSSSKNCNFSRSMSAGISNDMHENFSSSTNRVASNEYTHLGGMNNHASLYWDSVAGRCGESYGTKDSDSSFRAGGSNTHVQPQRADKTSSSGFSYNDNYTTIMTFSTISENDGKLDLFDSRGRQHESEKEKVNPYDQNSGKSGTKSTQQTDVTLSLDRRQADSNNFDSDFDFPANPRDFTLSSRLDGASTSRLNQQLEFHQPQVGFDNLCQPHKLASTHLVESSSQFVNASIMTEGKRMPSSSYNMEYGIENHSDSDYSRLSTSQKKTNFTHSFNEIPPDLEPVFNDTHSDFGGHQKILQDATRSYDQSDKDGSNIQIKSQTNQKEPSDNKWSSRPRAHRRIARILGSEELKNSFQTQDLSSSKKLSLPYPKPIPALDSNMQNKNKYHSTIHRDVTNSSRSFLTVEEELDLRTTQHDDRNFFRRDDSLNRHSSSQRDIGFMSQATFSFDSALPKESMSNLLNQQFLTPSHLDLDFHTSLSSMSQPQKDTDINQQFSLQVSKDFDMDAAQGTANQDVLAFDNPNSTHLNQSELSLPDNLGLGAHGQQDLNLEAYFNTATERDLSFGRKYSNQNQRDVSYASNSDNDFNIEDYMNPQSQRDLGPSYFDRTELPQDMTMYQKPLTEKSLILETVQAPKDRIKNTGDKGEISELQKELTKSTTKESMKGIRTPRDINRAMEILQGLQEDEKEEERRKEQKQRQQMHQSVTVASSPKKTFQNKHMVERMGIIEQHLLAQSQQFIDEQPVSLLDQPQLLADQQQDSLQFIAYPTFTAMHPDEMDMVSTLQGKREPQQTMTHNSASVHYQKRPKFSSKDSTSTQNSTYLNHSSSLASMLVGNSNQESSSQFSMPIYFQDQQPDLDITPAKPQSHSIVKDSVRPKKDGSSSNFETREAVNKSTSLSMQVSEEFRPPINTKQGEELMNASRKNLYTMMKREEFCDAVLSTPKQTVKVHQAVLCSMSQYLATLLLKMKPQIVSDSATAPMSPTSCYFTHTTSNQGVLLVINCDDIKPSSMSAFLVFIYLGKAEFSESNIEDLYMLACSLKVTSLKDMCKEFMWATQMSENGIKIPQLLVFSHRFETRDQSSMADLGSGRVVEDKAVNTGPQYKFMEATTQTDRTTTEAGEGGQEEWVMLKKTKQKTVSPSKSRLMTKAFTNLDSPANLKAIKKGWLSPKRRYKTENHSDDKINLKTDLPSNHGEEAVSAFNSSIYKNTSLSLLSDFNQTNQSALTSYVQSQSQKANEELIVQESENPFPSSSSESLQTKMNRTTVEIAEAAAAAKMLAHSYGTRFARGNTKHPVSYAVLATGQDKKKHSHHKEKTTLSKKKDFIKSNIPAEYDVETCMTPQTLNPPEHLISALSSSEIKSSTPSNDSTPEKHDTRTFVKRPFKKSIVHRTQSDEVLRNAASCDKDPFLEVNLSNNKTDQSLSSINEYIDTSVSNVSTLIDSLVNTMGVDFQKVISELDTELNQSPLLTVTSTSSVSSTSLTSPLKSPQTSQSTSEISTPVRNKSTPQGFRKRLIHMMNSENNSFSPTKLPSQESPGVHLKLDQSVHSTSAANILPKCEMSPLVKHTSNFMDNLPEECSTGIASENVMKCELAHSHESAIVSNIEEPNKASNTTTASTNIREKGLSSPPVTFSSLTDLDLGLRDEESQHFNHKIFKRKKKAKVKKILSTENESTSIKMKLKKFHSTESDGTSKVRQRKATGSDTEGNGNKVKQKKFLSGEADEITKVRPPPKKRAKMELELLKAANNVNKDGQNDEISSSLAFTEDIAGSSENSWTKAISDATSSKEELQQESPTGISDINKDSSVKNLDKQVDAKQPKKPKPKKDKDKRVTKGQSKPVKRIKKADKESSDISAEDERIIRLLEETKKTSKLKSQYSCKLCQTKIRSARRAVKHMHRHGLSGEKILENLSTGERVEGYEACSECGYKTKDDSYHYMHYHKYFKHGIPLPLGWSTDKCELCGKECFSKFQLKDHMQTHSDSSAFVCWHCGQSFKARNSLNSHVFHKHSDIRKHLCKACGKSFKTWTHLKVHVRSHTGERPYVCVECDHRSTTGGNMALHLSTHGYAKDKIQEIMAKICQNVTETSPEALDKIMIEIAEKVQEKKHNIEEKKPVKRKKVKQVKEEIQIKEEGRVHEDGLVHDESGKKKRSRVPKVKTRKENTTYVGPEIKRLFKEPLHKWKLPKLTIPQLTQPANVGGMSGSFVLREENGSLQLTQANSEGDSSRFLDINTLNLILQHQGQGQDQTSAFLIPLSQCDQASQQKQPITSMSSSVITYTVVPAIMLSNQTGAQASVDHASALPVLSSASMVNSGLTTIQAVSHPIQLMQQDPGFTTEVHLSIPKNELNSATEQGADSFISVSQQREETDGYQTAMSSADANAGSSMMMVLPSMTSQQSLHGQAQNIFNYADLMTSSHPLLLQSGNYVNFNGSEEIINVPQQCYTLIAPKLNNSIVEISELPGVVTLEEHSTQQCVPEQFVASVKEQLTVDPKDVSTNENDKSLKHVLAIDCCDNVDAKYENVNHKRSETNL